MCQMRRNEAESASKKVLDAKNDDEDILEVRRGVIMKQMMPYTLALIYRISASECARCEETKPKAY